MARLGAGTWTLRSHLMLLVVVACLPLALFAIGVAVLGWRSELQQIHQRARETVEITALAIDGELDGVINTAHALAASRHLASGNVRALYDDARDVLPTQRGWRTIILISAEGDQIFNLLAPLGTRLPPPTDRPHVRDVLATKKVAVSDLFTGRLSGRPTVDIAVPVVRADVLTHVLVVGMDPAAFNRLLTGEHIARGGIAAVWDRHYRFIARSRDASAFLGKPPIASLFAAMQRSPGGGVVRTPVYDGPDTYSSWRRTSYGWTVGIGVPAAAIEASLWRSLLLLGSRRSRSSAWPGWRRRCSRGASPPAFGKRRTQAAR
jgi:two-component system sensor histidine kinase UhpB